uniref:RNA-directed DNA polymerase n=3 Tax=Nyssomyia neivai TaxID=330878 RepID=A0A1L8DIS4_9DIPT
MERVGNLPPFQCASLQGNEARMAWVRWKRGFENVATALGETDMVKLKSLLLVAGGLELQDIFYSIPEADAVEGEGPLYNPYAIALQKLDDYFAPKRHEAFERYLFWDMKPEQDEPIERFILRLQEKAKVCNFGASDAESRAAGIIDRVLQVAPIELREKLLAVKGLNLAKMIKRVNAHQTVKSQAMQMVVGGGAMTHTQSEVNKIYHTKQSQGGRRADSEPKADVCKRCGRKHMPDKCPAMGKECLKCHLKNHFAAQCLSRTSGQGALKRKRYDQKKEGPRNNVKNEVPEPDCKKQRIRAVEDMSTMNEIKDSYIFNIGDGDEYVFCKVGGVLIEMLIDSGSAHNIIDEKTWIYMKKNGVAILKESSECHRALKAYGQDACLEILGVFEASVSVEDNGKEYRTVGEFHVVKNGSQSLLGKNTAITLQLLVVGLPSKRENSFTSTVNIVKDMKWTPFPKIKGIKINIPIDDSVTPVHQHPRRPPVALMKKIEDRLEQLLRLDIIEEVKGYSPWLSPIVIAPKGLDDIRLCVDMRRANEAILRQHYIMPTFEDFLPHLTKAKFFSRIDIKDAFHQVELCKACRHITTFITHLGVFRYKRLMYGLVDASEIYQSIMVQLLAGCLNALVYVDDIIVFGKDEAEHDAALKKVLDTLKEYNVLLNQEKCCFKVKQVTFLGHTISEDGIKPTEGKIEAIQSFRAPQTKEELRSFLGLVNYLSRFLKDCATVNHTLRELTRTDTTFKWEEVHEKAFQELKEMISKCETLSFFDNLRRTRVIADASPVGLGAVLVQFDSKEIAHIIAYASKSLSKIEKKYCQTEREALALVWAVEKFAVYLIGRIFELETDHKPLEAIFKPVSRPCARIERWVLRLQSFRYRVVYKKGSLNIADPLSRLSEGKEEGTFDGDDEYMVRAIMESAAMDFSEIEMSATHDAEMGSLRDALMTGNWKENTKPYHVFKDELGVMGNVVIRGDKIVVPQDLRARMLDLGHEGHPGMSAMKRRLRDRVWWPRMDSEIEKYVRRCEGCRLVSNPDHPEPMMRRELPSGPWIDVAADFMGPLPSGEYLFVIIDYYSRYMEIEIMSKITAAETTKRLRKIFLRLGNPITMTVDNGRQLVGREMEDFCAERKILLNNTTPYWPQQNGEVERQNRSLLKRLRISHAQGRNWKQDLEKYLLQYYTTPHSTTGKTPTELAYGRTIRGKIPSLKDVQSQPPPTEVSDRDRIQKQKGKEAEDKKRGAKRSEIEVGDVVLLKNVLPGNKLTTPFAPQKFVVIEKKGATAIVKGVESGKEYRRNVSHLKKVYGDEDVHQEVSAPDDDEETAGAQDEDQQVRGKRVTRPPKKLLDYV